MHKSYRFRTILRIRAAAKIEAVPAVVYVAVSMSAPGRVKHAGRGDLIIGNLPSNGRTIGQSEMYNTAASMENGIESVKKNAPTAAVDNKTAA